MAVPSLPLVTRNWYIGNLLFLAISSYSSVVLAAESMVILSGRDLIGLPGIHLSIYCDIVEKGSWDLTSRPYLKLYHLTRHDERVLERLCYGGRSSLSVYEFSGFKFVDMEAKV